MTALIRHLHEFAREVKLTPGEWMKGIEFLTEVGHITDDKRQEFILLSDTLGLSALVDLLANRGKSEAATESSLLGPFFREGAPEMAAGASIARGIEGEPLLRSRQSHLDRRESHCAARRSTYGRPHRVGSTICNSITSRARR